MTESTFWTFVDDLPIVRAERVLDMAQAALYPQLTRRHAAKWWETWASRADRQAREEQRQAREENGIIVNGRRSSLRGLRAWFQLMAGQAPSALQTGREGAA